MTGEPRMIVGDGNRGLIAVVADSDNTIYIGDIHEQNISWWTWTVHPDYIIENIHMSSSTFYIQCLHGTDRVTITSRFDDIYDDVAKDVMLDHTQTFTDVTTSITYTDPSLSNGAAQTVEPIVVATSGDYRGSPIPYTRVDQVLTLDFDVGGNCTVGFPYESEYETEKIRIRDEGGHVQGTARLTINRYSVHIANTPELDGVIQSSHAVLHTSEWGSLILGSTAALTDGSDTYEEETFHVPVNRRSTEHTLSLRTSTHYPATILGIEWFGKYNKRGRRF
jgi:hypothetical protein